jgi:hypothetical protein
MKRKYLIKSDIDLSLQFIFLASKPVKKFFIKSFVVFQDTEEPIQYESKNDSYFKNGKEITLKEFEEVINYCEENIFDCAREINKIRYEAIIEGSIYKLDVFKGSNEGLIILEAEKNYNDLSEEIKEIVIRDISKENIYINIIGEKEEK